MTSSSTSPATNSLRNDYSQVHRLRFEKSLEWLRPYLAPETRVIDLGGESPFTPMIRPLVGDLQQASGDLRTPLMMLPEYFDLVLCMEVIEHVADCDGLNTEWRGSGVAAMLANAWRWLKPGGILFLTTPNAASITAIHHAMRLAPPMIYRPHVREYAPYELDEIVRSAGFEIMARDTLDVWLNAITPEQHEAVSMCLYRFGYPLELRGEDIFMIARRPIFESPKAGG